LEDDTEENIPKLKAVEKRDYVSMVNTMMKQAGRCCAWEFCAQKYFINV
jgi:hypothetical protein